MLEPQQWIMNYQTKFDMQASYKLDATSCYVNHFYMILSYFQYTFFKQALSSAFMQINKYSLTHTMN